MQRMSSAHVSRRDATADTGTTNQGPKQVQARQPSQVPRHVALSSQENDAQLSAPPSVHAHAAGPGTRYQRIADESQSLLSRAEHRYSESLSTLIEVARRLFQMKTGVADSLLPMVDSRLAMIARQAAMEKDTYLDWRLRRFARWRQYRLASMSPAYAALFRQYHAIYARSARELAWIAGRLLKHTSLAPAAAIAVTIRDRLALMHQEAENEQDLFLTQVLGIRLDKLNAFLQQMQLIDDPSHVEIAPVVSKEQDDLQRRVATVAEARYQTSTQQLNALPPPDRHDSLVKDAASMKPYSLSDRPATSNEVSDQSLLEELFPEASTATPIRQTDSMERLPKLELPGSTTIFSRDLGDRPKTRREEVIEALQKSGESITVLQLENCSTELTEQDFRHLIPKGAHIDVWNRLGAYYKVIPGRNPLSLERLPFYYLLFKSPESAHEYQKNAARLHKLAALHQPLSLFSAIPAPKGFLEDGEDINTVTSLYLLRPTGSSFALRTLMQPYHPLLRTLFQQGGYKPIVPQTDGKGDPIYRVLMHIEGYEPSALELFKTLRQDAFNKGIPFPLRNESSSSVHRLRDLINLKMRTIPVSVSTGNPRAYDKFEFEDPSIAYYMRSDRTAEEENAKEVSQLAMNRVYNRWILDFDNEDEARRFAITWHRRVLPDFAKNEKTWKDYEQVRICNAELLW
ncbi:hypothetical protein ACEQ8H_004001 [Pleosporales sp. CAS-2024a]